MLKQTQKTAANNQQKQQSSLVNVNKRHTRKLTHAHTLCTSQYTHMLRHKRLIWDLILVVLDHVVGPAPVKAEKERMQSELDFFFFFFFLKIKAEPTCC